jgi:hypothetical protein
MLMRHHHETLMRHHHETEVVMNRLIAQQADLLTETHQLRDEVLNALSDADLSFHPGGTNPNLRELVLGQGAVQAAYAEAFRTFSLRFNHAAPESVNTLEEVKAWFMRLDASLKSALEALSDEDLAQPVDRGGWSVPAEVNFHVYREGLLIFAAKASVYLRALNRELPAQIRAWIG